MGSDLMSRLPVREHIRNIKRIMKMIAQMDRWHFFLTSIVHLVNVFVPYIQLMLSAYILDAVVEGKGFVEVFSVTACTLAGILVLNFIASSIWNRMQVRQEEVYYRYSCMTETRMLNMDFASIDSPKIKEMRDRMWRDNNWGAGINSVFWQFNNILYQSFDIIGAIVFGVPVIGYMVRAERYEALLVLAVLIVIGILLTKAGLHFRKINQFFMFHWPDEEERKEMAEFSWDFSMGQNFNYKNGKDIRIYGSYALMKHWTVDSYVRGKYRKRVKLGAIGLGGAQAVSTMLSSILEGGAYLMVSLVALAGVVSVGNLVRLSGCLYKLFSAVQNLISEILEFALTARKQVSTLEFLEVSDDMYKGKLPVEKRNGNEYQIEFCNVSFRYPNSEQYALKDFSMKLRIGEKLAIVGMNGSGKTTMIKLLCRLYDPDKGEILLNGVNIKKFKAEEYSRLFSVVFQDYTLFPYPLGQNVAVNTGYDAARVEKCLKDAGFGERLASLERGLDSYLYKSYDDSGIEISGGEEQKIAIARAIYKDAPFILLDEPTAALDPLAEYEIYSNFDRIVGNKTAIYISHRLSSCRFCEKIAVFHEGRLVQYGSHDELLKEEGGKYYEMWTAQAQYYQKDAAGE